jgi:adenosylcobyric acid synthase
MFTVAGQPEGALRADGRIMGSYLHGMFTEDAFRRAFLVGLGAVPGHASYGAVVEETLDALADHLAVHVDCGRLLALAKG